MLITEPAPYASRLSPLPSPPENLIWLHSLTHHAYRWLCYCSLVSQADPPTPAQITFSMFVPCVILKVIQAMCKEKYGRLLKTGFWRYYTEIHQQNQQNEQNKRSKWRQHSCSIRGTSIWLGNNAPAPAPPIPANGEPYPSFANATLQWTPESKKC